MKVAHARTLGEEGFALAHLHVHGTSLAWLPPTVVTGECTTHGTLVAAQYQYDNAAVQGVLLRRLRGSRPFKVNVCGHPPGLKSGGRQHEAAHAQSQLNLCQCKAVPKVSPETVCGFKAKVELTNSFRN